MKKELQSNLRRFIGMDLHTNKFNTCETSENSDERKRNDFSINDRDLKQFTSSLDKNCYVILESCTNAFKIAKKLRPFAKEVIVADTHKLKLIYNTNKKTDKIDAEKLSAILKMQIISGEELVNRVYIPNDDMQDLRSLFTSYNAFTNMIVATKNRIHSLLKENLIVFPKSELTKKMRSEILSLEIADSLKFQLELFIEQLECMEAKKDKIVNQIKIVGFQYYKQVEILTSIKGISVLSALAIMADICDINRFPNKKHLCSYLRSAPAVEISNETIKIKKTNKFSRKLSISFITQSVAHFKNTNPNLNKWYLRKTAKIKKGKIRMGACRKIITNIFSMLKKEEYHFFRDENNHRKKMKEYNNFLKKNDIIPESKVA